jgi:hypothetical protein
MQYTSLKTIPDIEESVVTTFGDAKGVDANFTLAKL